MRSVESYYTAFVLLTAVLFGLLFSGGARAADSALSRDDLIARLRLRADILVLGDDGKRLTGIGNETRVFSGFTAAGKYKSDWSTDGANFGAFKVRHEWTIGADGVIHVKFEEFAEGEFDSKTGYLKDLKNPIGTEERDVVDFGAVLYPVKAIKGKRVVLRFVPELASETRVETIGKFRLVGRGISIYDSEGMLWASDLEMGAAYSAITTYRGTLILSYAPFKGSEPAGVASGKRITLRMKEYPRVTLQSETDFVPEGMSARVFVKYLKEKRSAGPSSVHVEETANEQRILDSVK